MSYTEARQEVYGAIMKAVECGLVRLSAGNFSTRTHDGNVAITPAGIKYDVLQPEQIAIIDLNAQHVDGPCRASSEAPMHTAILRSLPEVGAVCHTHSAYAMTFAVLAKPIPLINLEALVCGAPIPVAEWACPGSAAAGEITVNTFKARPGLRAILLRNHGLVAIGKDLGQAFELAFDAEVAAQVYYQAIQIGQPIDLTEAQVQELSEIYG